ncbi:unnamed protein product [Cochlearia groenlandica]
MAERSFHLPISSSHSGRRMLNNNRRGVFPASKYWIHVIPVISFLCFFILWFFSHSVSLDRIDGEIVSIHRLEKSMTMRNESHVSLAILASSAVSPGSTNQNMTAHHNVTQSHNATDKPELRNREEGQEAVKGGRRGKIDEKRKINQTSPLAG